MIILLLLMIMIGCKQLAKMWAIVLGARQGKVTAADSAPARQELDCNCKLNPGLRDDDDGVGDGGDDDDDDANDHVNDDNYDYVGQI